MMPPQVMSALEPLQKKERVSRMHGQKDMAMSSKSRRAAASAPLIFLDAQQQPGHFTAKISPKAGTFLYRVAQLMPRREYLPRERKRLLVDASALRRRDTLPRATVLLIVTIRACYHRLYAPPMTISFHDALMPGARHYLRAPRHALPAEYRPAALGAILCHIAGSCAVHYTGLEIAAMLPAPAGGICAATALGRAIGPPDFGHAYSNASFSRRRRLIYYSTIWGRAHRKREDTTISYHFTKRDTAILLNA